MILAYVGASLFLAPALVLVSREVVPMRQVDPAVGVPAAVGTGVLAGSSPSTVGRTRHFVPTVVVALGLGVGIVERWWTTAPAYVTLVLVVLPVLTALAVIDIGVHRLPNRLTATLAALTATGLTLVAVIAAHTGFVGRVADQAASVGLVDVDTPGLAVRRALFGAIVLGAGYLALALLGGGSGMGLGDVKLAPSLGALTAWVGWDVWMTGAMAAFLLGGLWGVVLMLRGQGRHARMPFGPFMIAGALAAIAFA